MTSAEPRSTEWRILRAMDTAYLAACREWAKRDQTAGQSPHTHSERPMSPELFDAIFQ